MARGKMGTTVMDERTAGPQKASTLPVGAVTFLLTDIEGSSRLWEADDDAAARALARHREILDEAIGRHGGARPIEQGEGDSTLVAFARPSDAVAAALDAQTQLLREPWPTNEPLRVRMALHTGEAQLRDEGNYFGPPINRCARVRELGHGGQILISRTTYDLVADNLPAGATLRDLGSHRLRDLGRPEHVFQLCHPELTDAFPPLRSLESRPNNLPPQLTSFIGREHELAMIRRLLAADRLVTLIGSGGCGKTRLALHVAADVLDEYPDGVWWVDLAALVEPDLVPNAVGQAMGIREVPGESFMATLERILAARRTLVLLDNCEHLIDACAALCHALLRACPQLLVLATSREPLGVEGETTWRVPSLTMPEGGGEPESLAQYEAVRLVIDRALRARPTFQVTNDNAPAVAQICQRLDGVPLAIELAAARIRMLAPDQIAAGLDDRFRLLGAGARTAMPRQRTLEASVDWSYNLLNEEQKTLFGRLSAFTGSFALDSAEAVCSGDGMDAHQVFDVLLQLVDRSLIQAEEDRPRYRLLETIRQYGRQKLVDADEADAVRLRHLDHYTELVERAGPLIESGGTVEWLQRLDLERDNCRAAMDWALASGHADRGLLLATGWPLYWAYSGRMAEGKNCIGSLLTGAEPGTALLARTMLALATIAIWRVTDMESGAQYCERAIELARKIGDLKLEARALMWKGLVKIFLDPASAPGTLAEAASLATDAGDTWCATRSRGYLGTQQMILGDLAGARSVYEDVVEAARAASDLLNLTELLTFHGGIMIYVEAAAAERELVEALSIAESTGDRYFRPLINDNLGRLATMRGDYDEARSMLSEAIGEATETGHALALSSSLGTQALLERAVGNHTAAVELCVRIEPEFRANGLVSTAAVLDATAGWAAVGLGDLDRAAAFVEDGDALSRVVGSHYGVAFVRFVQALVSRHRGDLALAEDLARDGIAQLGTDIPDPDSFESLSGILALATKYEEAARLFGWANALRDRIGYVRPIADEDGYQTDVTIVRNALGQEAFTEAWDDGAALSTDEAVAYATRGRGERRRPLSGWESLTPTELEVVRFVTEGLTNPQIGERMFISRGTVKTHLAHVFAKLGMSTRSELATEATRRAT